MPSQGLNARERRDLQLGSIPVDPGPLGAEIGYSFESMTRRLRIPLALLAVFAAAAPLPALAQQKGPASPSTLPAESPSTNEPKTKEQLEAQQHFQRAKDLYQTGAYREAIAELEQARTLDPKGKDLVFNLGIVHEKLGKFDEAITFFRQYMEMSDVSAAERAKAENIIKRIEGAKHEVPPTPTASATSTSEKPHPPPEDTRRGRIDAATITAGSIGVAGLAVGTVFGILAVTSKPSNMFVTGTGGDGSYADLQSKADSSHRDAVIADVGFAVGVVGLAAAAFLYFTRTKEPRSVGLLPSFRSGSSGGSTMMLGGSFR